MFSMSSLLQNAIDSGLIFIQEFPSGMIAVIDEETAHIAVDHGLGEVRLATIADETFVRECSNWPFLIGGKVGK